MPITLTCSGCRRSFQLKDEMAGRKVRCPNCETVHVVPEPEFEEEVELLDGEDGGLDAAFNRDRFLFRQKVLSISEKYEVSDDEQRPVLFIERPAHAGRQVLALLGTVLVFAVTFILSLIIGLALIEKMQPKWIGGVAMGVMIVGSILLTGLVLFGLMPKRHIYFYSDQTKERLLLQVLQDQKFQFVYATYTVLDPEGRRLAQMKKNYLYNFFRKRWDVWDADGTRLLLIAREDSLLLSLLRRVLGAFYGLLRTNFILIVPESGCVEMARGEFNRKMTLFDRYVLDLTADRPRRIDRRLAVALGVLLDTGESR